MASLSDQIDRLSRHTKAISTTAASTAALSHLTLAVAGPFTRAVLSTPLGDLIRDIDPSELGLFNLTTPPAPNPHVRGTSSELRRVEFSGATPLRKANTRHDNILKPTDVDPEVYAQAALKYIDRYQTIRPMPRAYKQVVAILEKLDAVRANIQSLSLSLQQTQAAEVPTLKSLTEQKEREVQDLQERAARLQKRKQAAVAQKKRDTPSQSKPNRKPVSKQGKMNAPLSPHEDMFWNTPAAAAKTLRFTDNLLMDEHVDLGDISTTSFASPPPFTKGTLLSAHNFMNNGEPDHHETDVMDWDASEEPPEDNSNMLHDSILSHDGDVYEPEELEEKTIVLKKIASSTRPESPEPLSTAINAKSLPVSPRVPGPLESPNTKHPKIRVNSEVERIVIKIWATAGDIIMPGHLFDPSGSGTAVSKPPRAKETIAHLQMVSKLSPPPISPSASSASSLSTGVLAQPTSQQILTASLILSLLSSPPHFSLPLNKAKDVLAGNISARGSSSSQGTTRVLYGCVAKRLLKIERGGGEQVVKFDI